MFSLYNQNAPKEPITLSINCDLLKKAKDLDINLSASFEEALIAQLKTKQTKLWLEQNKAAIDAYNISVEENGVFRDELS